MYVSRFSTAGLRAAIPSLAVALVLGTMLAGVPAVTQAVNVGCDMPYNPTITPANFQDAHGQPNMIDNVYLPLKAGTIFTYDGSKEGQAQHNVVEVTSQHKMLMGVSTTVVRDTVWLDGVLSEDTFDWHAQDDQGNVWYFGEDSTEYPGGSTEGSWESGVGDNRPGIIMEAHPRSGDQYRQESAPGVAVDMASVVSLGRHVSVPYGSFSHVVETKEYSCLESGLAHKYYAPGIGVIKEAQTAGGKEEQELVSIQQP
jgi:hypothetical protein